MSQLRVSQGGMAGKGPGHGVSSRSSNVHEYRSQGSMAPRRTLASQAVHTTKSLKDEKKEEQKQAPFYKRVCRQICDNNVFVGLTTVLTLYALFGDNTRLMATEKAADNVFDGFTLVAMVVFLFEVVIASIGKDDYFLGFFFTLDVVSTLSLMMDLSWVNIILFCQSQDEDDTGGSAVRASRASRAGTRAGRVVRVIRLIRIVKLYKAMQDAKAKKRREALRAKRGPGGEDDFMFEDDMEEQDRAESRVGKKLSDMTTRRVIILVLMMLFVLPYLEANSSSTMPFSSSYGVDQVHRSFMKYDTVRLGQDSEVDPKDEEMVGNYAKVYFDELLTFVYYHIEPRDYFTNVLWIGFGGDRRKEMAGIASVAQSYTNAWTKVNKNDDMGEIPSGAKKAIADSWNQDCSRRTGASLILAEEGVACPEELRCQEVEIVSPTLINQDLKSGVFIAQFDKRPLIKQEALLDTFKILFICVVLGAGSMMFAKDANNLVLNPLEAMISKIEQIKNNPLIALKLGDDEFKREEIEKQKKKEKAARKGAKLFAIKEIVASNTKHEPMETLILEKTIIKLGTLLALGFGEAGSKIIGQNMQGGDSATVNAMIPGHRVDCILSVVSIRDFAIVNQVLQKHVMTFVNQIAEIVHGLADEYHGAANRSNGDSFLLVWRATDDMPDDMVTKLAEMSLLAVIKILSGIAQSNVLAEYRGHPGLLQRVPTYRVSIGSSLHFGWTIEGAIGSEFKIDASYLSPNVNVTTKLEEATNTYGCHLILSQNIVGLMSDPMIQACRVIDCVVVPGCKEPMRIFTFDLDTGVLPLEAPLKTEGLIWNARRRFKARQVLEVQKNAKWSDDSNMHDLFLKSEDIKTMRSPYEERFFQIFGMAYHNYVAGEWEVALGMLSQTRMMLKSPDGPSVALVTFINSSKETKAPEGWTGYRDLPQREAQTIVQR